MSSSIVRNRPARATYAGLRRAGRRALALTLGVAWMFCATASVRSADKPRLPQTSKKPVTDEYHGVKVSEDYRWLENMGDPAVRAWSDSENAVTRAYLDEIPDRPPIYDRLKTLYTHVSNDYYSLRYRKGVLFALKSQPPKEQPFLVTLKSADDTGSAKVIVDVNQLDPSGGTSIDFFQPSLDGRLVAVSLSQGGSELGSVSVFEVADGKKLPDVIPGVNGPTAGGSVAWNADGSGFYYTRYPRPGERPAQDASFYQQTYFHRLGTPTSEDTYAIGKEFPKIAEIQLQTSPDGRYILATVANGDGGEFAHYLLDPSGKWTQITQFSDKVTEASLGWDGALYMYTHKDAPRGRVLRLPLETPELSKARVFVEESDVAISWFVPAPNYLYVVDMVGGPSQIRVFTLDGQPQPPVPIMPVSAVWGILPIGGDTVLFNNVSYTEPPAWYQYVPATGKATRTVMALASLATFNNVEVVREFATSRDGTKVPINIMRRKGVKLDGQNPTVLYGYGGYGINQSPDFDAGSSLWLEQGGVYAVANLRGGGEFGEDWHRAGNLTRKQNVFDDFAACAEYLIKAGYTSSGKLAIQGGSNGGLLMGAALTQHPDLFRAVVSAVGIYDMIRVELDPNGAFNVTEFGTVTDPEQFKALYAYSPYHHVVDGTRYPAVLFLTGENDGRVNPANSRKMTARLQAAGASGLPVLLRTSSTSGHGIGTGLSERIARDADIFAFLFRELGIQYRPVQ